MQPQQEPSTQNLVIKYSKPYTFIKRPFSYGDSLYSDYARSYTVNGMDINGTGNSKTVADGYGTLMLPAKTYNDVIRVKFEQFSYDVIMAGDTQFVYTRSYAWFDAHHKSALLKIDSVSIVSRFFSDHFKEGIVLTEEFSTGIYSENHIVKADFDLFNSTDRKLWLHSKNANVYNVEIFSLSGQVLYKTKIYAGADQKQIIPIAYKSLNNSFVLVRVSNSKTSRSIKISKH